MKTTVSILDYGNAFLKCGQNTGEIKIIPSCSYRLSTADLRERRDHSDDSPLIHLDGETYLIGVEAQEYGGSNNWSGDKLSNLLLGVCAAHDESQRIDQLVVSVPDSSMDLDFSHLIGIHNYAHNDRQIQLEIVDVETIDETYGIWLGSKSLYQYPDQNNIAITIGAGTINLVCYSGQGTIRYRAVNDKLGMLSIASSISRQLKSTHNLASTPKVGLIMRGMAEGNCVLAGAGIDFSIELAAAISQWRSDLKEWITDCVANDVTYWQFAFGGAGAGYLPESRGNVIIVPDPQVFAIRSLLSLYEN